MKTCKKCGTENVDSNTTCWNCGKSLESTTGDGFNSASNEGKHSTSHAAAIIIAVLLLVLIGIGIVIIFQLRKNDSKINDVVDSTAEISKEPEATIVSEPSKEPEPEQNNEVNFSELSKRVLYLELFDNKNQVLGSGSGFVVQDGNVVVTNFHVVEGTSKITLTSYDGTVSAAVFSALGYDQNTDLAFLPCPKAFSEYTLNVGDSNTVEQGDKIFVSGYPLGVSNTLSDGIISSMYKDELEIDVIQITAPISPGSSGGALFDSDGNVVGIIRSSYVDGENMNIAIASNVMTAQLESLDAKKTVSLSDIKYIIPYDAPPLKEKPNYNYTPVSLENLYNNPAIYNGSYVSVTAWVGYYAYYEPELREHYTVLYMINNVANLLGDKSLLGNESDEDAHSWIYNHMYFRKYINRDSIPYIAAVILDSYLDKQVTQRDIKMTVYGKFTYNPTSTELSDVPFPYQIDVYEYSFER